jgi:predicted AAA+ superfamily ATPase
MKMTESMLNKLSKKELIQLILDSQEVKEKTYSTEKVIINEPTQIIKPIQTKHGYQVLSQIDYEDIPVEVEWKEGAKPTPRRPPDEAVYICRRCTSKFKAKAGLFAKDRNEPICNRCMNGSSSG